MATLLIDFENGDYELNGTPVAWSDLIEADVAVGSTFDISLVQSTIGLVVDSFLGAGDFAAFKLLDSVFALLTADDYLTFAINYQLTMDLGDPGSLEGAFIDVYLSDLLSSTYPGTAGLTYQVGSIYGPGENTSFVMNSTGFEVPLTNDGLLTSKATTIIADIANNTFAAQTDAYPQASVTTTYLGFQKISFWPGLLGSAGIDPPVSNQKTVLTSISITSSMSGSGPRRRQMTSIN